MLGCVSRKERRCASTLVFVFGVCGIGVGCSGAQRIPQETPEATPAAEKAPETGEVRPPLSADERQIKENLTQHVSYLSTKLGERSPGRPWELADASDYIAQGFEALGYPIERQGYEVEDAVAQNLTVKVGGGERGDQVILVSAHYDSPPGDSGRQGSASSVAALLELARLMQGASLKRTIQFSAFALGESPHGDGEGRGARRYIRGVQERQARDQAKLEREEQQRRRGELPADFPELPIDRSRFVTMISLGDLLSYRPMAAGKSLPIWISVLESPLAEPFAGAVAKELDEPPFLVQRGPLSGAVADSDAKAFQEAGIPVVLVDGTRAKGAADDFDALARVVMALRSALGVIAEERPSTDPGSLLGSGPKPRAPGPTNGAGSKVSLSD